MAKLAVVASFLLALLALAEATSYTTITTTVVEEDNPHGGSQQRCSQQVQSKSFRQCSRYLSQQGRPYELAEMEVEDVNPAGMQSQQLQRCCEELRNVDQQCQCAAIRQMVSRQQQQGQGGQWEGQQGDQRMQQVVEKAQRLPQSCNLRLPQQCQIRAIWF